VHHKFRARLGPGSRPANFANPHADPQGHVRWPLEPGRPDPLCAASPLKLPWGKKRPRSKQRCKPLPFVVFSRFCLEEKIPQDIQRALMSSSAGAYQSPDQRSREFKDHRRQADAWIGCDRGMGTNPCRETLPRRKYIGRTKSFMGFIELQGRRHPSLHFVKPPRHGWAFAFLIATR
jgi:hypothetical protein